jgi:hypothetical protein
MLILSLVNALFYYQLSLERYSFILPSCALALAAFLALWFWHASIFWVAGVMFITAGGIFLFNLQTALKAETR